MIKITIKIQLCDFFSSILTEYLTIILCFYNILLTLNEINLNSKNSIIKTYEKQLLFSSFNDIIRFFMLLGAKCADDASAATFALYAKF